MDTERYHFKIGTFECTVISDGTRAYPHPASYFFANAPKERLAQVLRAHNLELGKWEQYVSPYPSLAIDTGQHRVLVDTGAGDLAPTTGKLMSNLQVAGIAPEDVDVVILTHGHGDHIGGNLDEEGQPAFPNARYVMWRDEWEYWTSDPDLSSLKLDEQRKQFIIALAQKNLLPIEGRLDLIDRESDIVPGVRAIAAPGHTPGHMAVAISSSGEKLLDVVDAVLHPIHLEQPDWNTVVDHQPEQTVATRHLLLERAAAEEALVFAYHFPAPGLGHVIRKRAAWQWQPIEIGR